MTCFKPDKEVIGKRVGHGDEVESADLIRVWQGEAIGRGGEDADEGGELTCRA
jgi:hypothetical protein